MKKLFLFICLLLSSLHATSNINFCIRMPGYSEIKESISFDGNGTKFLYKNDHVIEMSCESHDNGPIIDFRIFKKCENDQLQLIFDPKFCTAWNYEATLSCKDEEAIDTLWISLKATKQ
ncbi:hypothetical protein M1446_03695 [Candidatus Dependentiae bacterium]|nr:hypothetical protein [Candidatus Dependentiae bacterium]